jgi:hypothetical protein
MYLIIKETTFKSHAPIFQVVNQTTELSLADTLAKCLNAEAKEQNENYNFKVCTFGSVAYEAYCPEDDELVRWANKVA